MHSKPVIRLKATDNPPVPTPPYPGLWHRNNTDGIMISKMEYLQNHTNQWLDYVKNNKSYEETFMADKAKVLILHLQGKRKSDPNFVTHNQCRQLITRAELWLQQKEHSETPPEDETDSEHNGGKQSDQQESPHVEHNLLDEFSDNESLDDDWDDGWDKGDRSTEDKILRQFLSRTDSEIFESNISPEDFLGFKVSNRKKFKSRREAYSRKVLDNLSDKDLFQSGEVVINKHIRESKVYEGRKEHFSSTYYEENLEGQSSQEILSVMSQTPSVVIESETFKNRISHLSKKERAEMAALKSARDTVKSLDENPSIEGREQKKQIIASLTSLRFGPPEFGLSWREEKDVIEMKRKLLSGEERILKVLPHKRKQIFPIEVTQAAKQHWEEITQVDPSKIRRPNKAAKDGEETVPTRFQVTTNEEAFQSFKEQYSDQVEQIMLREAKEQEERLLKRKDSEDKENRLQYVRTKLPKKFPCLSWFIEQRPQEVKLMNDHSKGMCKVMGIFL